ncbi:hypothetical protein DV738_g2931, partial [Chaetothyriales sp. CBS 135597]
MLSGDIKIVSHGAEDLTHAAVHLQGPVRGIMELERIKQQLRLSITDLPPTPSTSRSLANVLAVTEESPQYSKSNAMYGSSDVTKLDMLQHQPARQQHYDTARPMTNLPDRKYSGMLRPVKTARLAEPVPASRGTVTGYQDLCTSDAEDDDFDLRPPAPLPRSSSSSVERISQLLFSPTHLHHLLQDPASVTAFTRFLSSYKPEYVPLVLQYLQYQKAIKAVEYANALAEEAANNGTGDSLVAATLDNSFKEASISVSAALVDDALPSYITQCLVKVVTESLSKGTADQDSPVIDRINRGLFESFCITDPKQVDNPIVYASKAFYWLTGFGPDVIGRNCRFLQGSKTSRDAVNRLKNAVERGEEHCEALLNYRKDGQPFINLLTIAPLRDNKGNIRYYIGGQVDVSSLVEHSQGLEAFARCLHLEQSHQDPGRLSYQDQGRPGSSRIETKALTKLRELSELFDLEEFAVVQSHRPAGSMRFNDETKVGADGEWLLQRQAFVMSGHSDPDVGNHNGCNNGKIDASGERLGLGPHSLSGKLPGVYNAYMLIRAAPSLRIVFISPRLAGWSKIVQNPFLSHVAASATTLVELHESFTTGSPVSAKVALMITQGGDREGTKIAPGSDLDAGKYGKVCWISATPLTGSDDRVGVWMVVVNEMEVDESITRSNHTSSVPAKVIRKTPASQQTPFEANEYAVDPVSRNRLGGPANEFDDLGDKRHDKRPDNLGRKLGHAHHQPELPTGVQEEVSQTRSFPRDSVEGQLPFQSTEEIDLETSRTEELSLRDNKSDIHNRVKHHTDIGHEPSSPDLRSCLAVNPTPPLTPEMAHNSSPPFTVEELIRRAAPVIQHWESPQHTTSSAASCRDHEFDERLYESALANGAGDMPDDRLAKARPSRHVYRGYEEEQEIAREKEKEEEVGREIEKST